MKINDIIIECYTELYANSDPQADFQKLMQNAEINEAGEKIIDYMDYKINIDKMNEIIEKHSKKMPIYLRKSFKNTILLGCSPVWK